MGNYPENSDKIWLSLTKSGRGIRVFVKQPTGADKMYVGSFATLQKMTQGTIKAVPLSAMPPHKTD